MFKKLLSVMLMLLTTISLSGCLTTHINRGTASNLVEYLYPNGEAVDHSQDEIPHLKLPLKVGVAFVPESGSYFNASLNEASKQKLLEKVAKKFEGRQYIQSITIIPEIYLKQGRGFNALERIAAMHNVDVMAMVSYDQVVKGHENIASIGYWTIVGAWLLPGNTNEASTFVDTAVFDIKTHRLLFRAPGYSERSELTTAIAVEANANWLANREFAVAMDKMIANLDAELEKFRERAKKGEEVKISYRQGYGGGSMGLWGSICLVLLLLFNRKK